MAKPLMCAPELLSKDLSDRRYVVTGANSGIGLETAKQLMRQGATVVFGCRRTNEADEAIAAFTAAESPRGESEVYRLDLADLASVRTFAATVVEAKDALHGLVNNAGVMNTPQGATKDGFEMQLGVNHIGHFLLTQELENALERAAPSRVVNVSSCYHDKAMGRPGDVDLNDPFFESREYDGWAAYAQSKLANLLHARELSKRLSDRNIQAVSVHPGWVRTNLARHSMPLFLQDYVLRPVMRLMGMIEPWEGTQTTLHALLTDDLENGGFYSQTGVYRDRSCNAGGWPLRSPNPNAHDDALAAALYERSQEWVSA